MPTVPANPAVKDTTKRSLPVAYRAFLVSLQSQFSSIGLTNFLNPSFDFDLDSDNYPDTWTYSTTGGGSGTYDQTNNIHGIGAFTFTRNNGAGNDGGTLVADNFIPISPGDGNLKIWYKADQAARTDIKLKFYDDAATPSLVSTVTKSIQEQTSMRRYNFDVTIPGGDARQLKIEINGGTTGVDPGADANITIDGYLWTQTEYANYDSVMDGNTYGPASTTEIKIVEKTMYLHSDITTLAVTMTVSSTNGSPEVRIKIGATNGTTITSDGVGTSTITVPAGSKGTYETVEVWARNPVAAQFTYAQLVSNITNGKESKIVVT